MSMHNLIVAIARAHPGVPCSLANAERYATPAEAFPHIVFNGPADETGSATVLASAPLTLAEVEAAFAAWTPPRARDLAAEIDIVKADVARRDAVLDALKKRTGVTEAEIAAESAMRLP